MTPMRMMVVLVGGDEVCWERDDDAEVGEEPMVHMVWYYIGILGMV